MTVTNSVRRTDSAAIRVLEAVAAARDVDIETLKPPLGTVIDPDALDAILDADGDVAVSFSYANCRVSVTSDDVDVRVLPDEAD